MDVLGFAWGFVWELLWETVTGLLACAALILGIGIWLIWRIIRFVADAYYNIRSRLRRW